jgi:glyoxylase-like metal-dependent hydrolase (beta-lactamase superfamily II)
MRVQAVEGRGFSGNIYLIDAQKPCLIDTGWEADISYCSEQVREALGGRPLSNIVLTHRHIDHVGGAMSFRGEFGGELLAHEMDAKSLQIGDQVSTGAALFGGEIPCMPVAGLRDGDHVDLGGGESLRVLHTPGHTVGSICLLGQGCLFSGDTIFADGGVGRWDLETGDYDGLLSSIEKLASLDFDAMFPGHGPAVERDAAAHASLSLRHLRVIGRYG